MSSWLRKTAELMAEREIIKHKISNTPIDIVDIADAIEVVARAFAERAIDFALGAALGKDDGSYRLAALEAIDAADDPR